MGYSVWDFFNDVMEKYTANFEEAVAAEKAKPEDERCEKHHDLDIFLAAFKDSSEYRRKTFIHLLIKSEAEVSGESEEEVIEDALTQYSDERLVIARFPTRGGFSFSRSLPKGFSLRIDSTEE